MQSTNGSLVSRSPTKWCWRRFSEKLSRYGISKTTENDDVDECLVRRRRLCSRRKKETGVINKVIQYSVNFKSSTMN